MRRRRDAERERGSTHRHIRYHLNKKISGNPMRIVASGDVPQVFIGLGHFLFVFLRLSLFAMVSTSLSNSSQLK